MKTLNAKSQCIHEIFYNKQYIIPEFQRPYSWDKEQCIKLLEDIKNFFNESKGKSEKYYLGNVVLYKDKDNAEEEYFVIDGQQRLTTIMLLLNALFSKAQTFPVLEECIKRKDKLRPVFTNDLKIESRVIENDKKELEDIVFNKNYKGNSRIKQNYNLISEKLEEWMKTLSSKDAESFIESVLYNTELLPMACDSLDDALILFNTVNNRGLPLNDADIFKSHLFKYAKTSEDKNVLVQRWNALNENEKIESLFRRLMHIKRAEEGEKGKEIALRTYFEKNNNKRLKDWEKVLDDLEKINAIDSDLPTSELKNLWNILHYVPNEYSLYPIIVFWYKNATINKEGDSFTLSDENIDKLSNLMKNTARYSFASAIVYNSVNPVKDPIHEVCVEIYHDGNYLDIYKQKYFEKTFPILEERIENCDYSRCKSGLLYLLAFLNKNQNQKELNKINKLEIEHILPQRGFNNYNGWTKEQYDEKLNTLGNLVLLEEALNIKASNEFFNRKKKEYEKSYNQEAKDLCKLSDWTYEEWKERDTLKRRKLIRFFEYFD